MPDLAREILKDFGYEEPETPATEAPETTEPLASKLPLPLHAVPTLQERKPATTEPLTTPPVARQPAAAPLAIAAAAEAGQPSNAPRAPNALARLNAAGDAYRKMALNPQSVGPAALAREIRRYAVAMESFAVHNAQQTPAGPVHDWFTRLANKSRELQSIGVQLVATQDSLIREKFSRLEAAANAGLETAQRTSRSTVSITPDAPAVTTTRPHNNAFETPTNTKTALSAAYDRGLGALAIRGTGAIGQKLADAMLQVRADSYAQHLPERNAEAHLKRFEEELAALRRIQTQLW